MKTKQVFFFLRIFNYLYISYVSLRTSREKRHGILLNERTASKLGILHGRKSIRSRSASCADIETSSRWRSRYLEWRDIQTISFRLGKSVTAVKVRTVWTNDRDGVFLSREGNAEAILFTLDRAYTARRDNDRERSPLSCSNSPSHALLAKLGLAELATDAARIDP